MSTLDEKVHRIGGPAEKRGAPADKARAFDKVNARTGARKNRSVLKALEKAKSQDQPYIAIEVSEDPDYTMVLVIGTKTEPYTAKGEEYYGVNVLFYPDGKIDASTADSAADWQWAHHKRDIIKVAKKQLKTGAPMGDTDADVRAYHGAGDGDYSGYKDKKMNEGKLSFKQFLLFETDKKVTEPGWYVCDGKNGKVLKGPMSEKEAKKYAEEHGSGWCAEYYTDYEIKRMNESSGKGSRGPGLTGVGLSAAEGKELIKDFEEWSGGFTPDDCTTEQIQQYIKSGMSSKFPKKAAIQYLKYIRDNGASNAP